MGIVRENINFERGLEPKRSMGIGLYFETFSKLGRYAFNRIKEITGSDKLIFHKEDPNLVDISQYKRIQAWFEKIKNQVDPKDFKKRNTENFSEFWQGFIEKYNETR